MNLETCDRPLARQAEACDERAQQTVGGRMPVRLLVVVALGVVLAVVGGTSNPQPRLLYGPLVGDLTASTAVVWCRGEGLARVTCELRAATPGAEQPVFSESRATSPQRSCAAKFAIHGLQPATDYSVTIPELSARSVRHFRTMPAPTEAVPLRLAFSADVGGQHIGRDVERSEEHTP